MLKEVERMVMDESDFIWKTRSDGIMIKTTFINYMIKFYYYEGDKTKMGDHDKCLSFESPQIRQEVMDYLRKNGVNEA